jgi:hypothetical protein
MSIIKDVMNNMLKIVSYTIVDWEKVRNINFQLVLIVFFNVKTVKKCYANISLDNWKSKVTS